MPQQVAATMFVLFMLWLFIKDRKLRPMESWVLWIPVLWLVVIGSRPLSLWFATTTHTSKDGSEEGGLLEVIVYFLLIAMGTIVAAKRKVDWSQFISKNRWVVIYLAYCGVSVLWSDYPFVGFKRWTKDVTNVIMLLIIFTEKDSVQAFKAVWARYIYVLVPVSVLFIKYYPDWGRIYNQHTFVPNFVGLTSEKNSLGQVALISGLILVWDFIESRRQRIKAMNRIDMVHRIILLLMTIYLIHMADSSTALVCFVLGVGLLVAMQSPVVLRQAKNLGVYALAGAILGMGVYVSGAYEAFLEMLGEDPTLTGRTGTWESLLRQPINPLLGTGGYRSFWTSSFAESTKEHYYFYINQSHNGYLETYLNNGLIGLFLLVTMILTVAITIRKELVAGSKFAILRFVFFLIVVFGNWTEATFNTLNPLWFVFLMATISYSHPNAMVGKKVPQESADFSNYSRQSRIA